MRTCRLLTLLVASTLWPACRDEFPVVATSLPDKDTCPAGSFPEYTGEVASECSARADLDLIEQDGSVVGACRATASATLFCRFTNPCSCGVDFITSSDFECNEGIPCGSTCCDTGQSCVQGTCVDHCLGTRCGISCCDGLDAVCLNGQQGAQTCCNSGVVCGDSCCPHYAVCAGSGESAQCCLTGLACGNECCPDDVSYHCEQGACVYSY
jgi:hypothetical protein